ncbi:unnamed protein product, partial [Lasius platythorax]
DLSPAPSAVPSIPSSSVDTAACLTASEKEDFMCVSDAEIGERTVFEGSPSESQEDEITKNKAKNKRVAIPQKRKRKRKSLILDFSEEELEFPELRNKRDRAIADELRNIKEMTTTSLATLLFSWINECENVRQISTSFKGELNGKLRDRLTRMRIGVTALGNKAAPPYDAASLKIDNDILHIKLEELQKQNDDLREEMNKLKCSIERLTAATLSKANLTHHISQTSPPVSPLPPRGKPLPLRETKKVQLQSTSKSLEHLSPVKRPPIKGQVALLTDKPANLLPAAELIPPGRSKEDVLDELIRDLKTLKKRIIESKEQLGETSLLSPEPSSMTTQKNKKRRENEPRRVLQKLVTKVTTSEQDTTEAQYTEDGYPKDGEPWTSVANC